MTDVIITTTPRSTDYLLEAAKRAVNELRTLGYRSKSINARHGIKIDTISITSRNVGDLHIGEIVDRIEALGHITVASIYTDDKIVYERGDK
jgi:hypothetical protein